MYFLKSTFSLNEQTEDSVSNSRSVLLAVLIKSHDFQLDEVHLKMPASEAKEASFAASHGLNKLPRIDSTLAGMKLKLAKSAKFEQITDKTHEPVIDWI